MEQAVIIEDAMKVDRIGEITVKIYRSSSSVEVDNPVHNISHALADNETHKFHEKALKGQAKSHSTL
jgi:hypothetical protein